jgi:hypothetical protein
VAITQARIRMSLMNSFSGREMDPERLNSMGSRMLRDCLLYAESGGSNIGILALAKPRMNPFECDVYELLSANGISLVPQFVQSGYWIDFRSIVSLSEGST